MATVCLQQHSGSIMSKRAFFLFIGIFLAGAYILRLRRARGTAERLPRLDADELYYSHLSPAELESRHLLDLNAASEAQLSTLGLDADALRRLLDNRPYRTKLELVSRMIVPENVYAAMKDRIEVARGDEPVKTA
jgi:hypothetical protein